MTIIKIEENSAYVEVEGVSAHPNWCLSVLNDDEVKEESLGSGWLIVIKDHSAGVNLYNHCSDVFANQQKAFASEQSVILLSGYNQPAGNSIVLLLEKNGYYGQEAVWSYLNDSKNNMEVIAHYYSNEFNLFKQNGACAIAEAHEMECANGNLDALVDAVEWLSGSYCYPMSLMSNGIQSCPETSHMNEMYDVETNPQRCMEDVHEMEFTEPLIENLPEEYK